MARRRRAEPQFFDALIAGLGLDGRAFAARWNPASWPALRARLEEAFAQRTRDEWAAIFAGTDACVAPALDLDEAPRHPHNVARETFLTRDGALQPAPAPRFSRTKPEITRGPAAPGEQGEAILRERGFSLERIEALKQSGAL